MLKLWKVHDGEETSWWAAESAEAAKAEHIAQVADPEDPDAEWAIAEPTAEAAAKTLIDCEDRRGKVGVDILFAECVAAGDPGPTCLGSTVY